MQHYTSHYLAEILRDLYFEESTGCLEVVEPAGWIVRLHFDRGMLYFASGDNEEEQLPALLSSSGLIPAATVSKLRQSAPDPLDLAGRLVSSGVLTTEALAPVVRETVERGVVRAFSWPSGACTFTAQEPLVGFFVPDILFTFECLLKGIRAMAHFQPLKEVLIRLPGRLKMRDKLFLPIHRLALKPTDGYVLSRVDGSMRLDEIALLLPPGEEESCLLFLYGLAVLGLLEFVPPLAQGPFSLREVMHGHYDAAAREERDVSLIKQTAERVIHQSPEEILGVDMRADLAAVQKAYDEARRLFRRDRFIERVREKHKKELDFIDNKLAEAFLKLQVARLEKAGSMPRDDVARSEIDPHNLQVRREMVKTKAQSDVEQNEKLADNYYQKAREYFHDKDYHNCIQFCRLAIKFNENTPAHVYALMGDALARNPHARWQKMAEEALLKACELDPWNAEFHVALGQFYVSRGLAIRARRQFEKALEILPSHAAAAAAMKALPRERRHR
ncbi:MAG: tetratricopeptide repeat protein [Candidatus Polarisedimenticolia bacterium]